MSDEPKIINATSNDNVVVVDLPHDGDDEHEPVAVNDKNNKEPKEKETLLINEIKANQVELDDFDDTVRPVYDTTTVKIPIAKARTEKKNWLEDLSKIQQETNGLFDFIRNARKYVKERISPWVWLIIALFIFLYSLSMMIVGCVNVNECDVQPNIAVYMIVAGLFTMIIVGWHVFIELKRLLSKNPPSLIVSLPFKIVDALVTLFLVIWFIAGCVWIYGVYPIVSPEYIRRTVKDRRLNYCAPGLYRFAFATVTMAIVFTTCLIFAAVLLVLYLKLRKLKSMETG